MGLDRSKYSTDQQYEIEHCVREAMEVSRDPEEELRKCDVVCANCHRIRTFKKRGGAWLPQ